MSAFRSESDLATRHSAASDITSQHCQEQLTYDAVRILDFNADARSARSVPRCRCS
jgi:hypothetical protein